ncbi:ABC transporter permease [Ilumatobacter nonamiensis]|uniref:ABC transporter permease n=1 Tax=Ilumatobacter nonamiensis TaxID=467093 RepID=UPI00058DA1D9|nr:ABC transporter permease [Ilumatobacter nonamiensis]
MNPYPTDVSLVARQIRYQLTYFFRIPVALFFTIILPIVMLVLFNAIFGDNTVSVNGAEWPIRQFYTGGLAAFTAVSATYSNIGNMVPIRRDEGILKRWRSTPLPTWTYLAGLIGSSIILAFAGTILMITMGAAFYDLSIEWQKMPAAFVTLLVGVAAFAALGMALVSVIKTASSSAAVVNATILPLAFISDVFVSTDDDGFLNTVANLFPLKPFVNAFQDCFNPFVDGSGFAPDKLAFVAAWGVAGALVAIKRFTWEPSGAAPRRGRRARRAAAEASA